MNVELSREVAEALYRLPVNLAERRKLVRAAERVDDRAELPVWALDFLRLAAELRRWPDPYLASTVRFTASGIVTTADPSA